MKAKAVKLDGELYTLLGKAASANNKSMREQLDLIFRNGLQHERLLQSPYLKRAMEVSRKEWGALEMSPIYFIDACLMQLMKFMRTDTRGLENGPSLWPKYLELE
jgi:hypothetical protein